MTVIEKQKKLEYGKKIRRIREYLGYSRTDFGNLIGYSDSHLARMEKDQVVVRQPVIDRICGKFNVDPAYFTNMDVDDISKAVERNEEEYDHLSASERVKLLRESKGWSQLQLAEKSGMEQPYLSNIENEKHDLYPKQAEKLADCLKVGTEYLLTGNLKKKNYPVNNKMIDWLWEHEDVRKGIWEKMEQHA